MKKVLRRKKWTVEVVEQHVYPPPIPPVKINHNDKSDKYFVELKLRRDPTSDKLDLYDFKMSLFENVDPEEFFCLFVTSI